MDDKPHRRRPAKTSLPSASEKEELTAALNAKLPKVVQPPPLAPPLQAPLPVEDQGTAGPSFDASSDKAASYAAYPNDGYNCGVARGVFCQHDITAPRWMTANTSPGQTSATSKQIVAHTRRRVMWTHSRLPVATNTGMAKAYARPLKRRSERTKRQRRSTVWNAS
jgi:hypothetical protein